MISHSHVLDLYHKDGRLHVQPCFRELKKQPDIQTLIVTGYSNKIQSMMMLSNELKTNTTLSELKFADTDFPSQMHDAWYHALAELIRHNKSLTRLNIAEISLTRANIDVLLKAFRANYSLTEFYVGRVRRGRRDMYTTSLDVIVDSRSDQCAEFRYLHQRNLRFRPTSKAIYDTVAAFSFLANKKSAINNAIFPLIDHEILPFLEPLEPIDPWDKLLDACVQYFDTLPPETLRFKFFRASVDSMKEIAREKLMNLNQCKNHKRTNPEKELQSIMEDYRAELVNSQKNFYLSGFDAFYNPALQ